MADTGKPSLGHGFPPKQRYLGALPTQPAHKTHKLVFPHFRLLGRFAECRGKPMYKNQDLISRALMDHKHVVRGGAAPRLENSTSTLQHSNQHSKRLTPTKTIM